MIDGDIRQPSRTDRTSTRRQDERHEGGENVRTKGREEEKVDASRKEGLRGLPGGGTTPNLNTNYPTALPLLILRRFIPRTDAANHVDLRGLPSSTKRRQST